MRKLIRHLRNLREVPPMGGPDPAPPTDLWVIRTPNGRGCVWPNMDGFVPASGRKYYHWKATIHHRLVGVMEAHYETPEAARGAVEAMLGGSPDDWERR